MRWGISGRPIPDALLYAADFNHAAADENFPPLWIYAIGWREAISGEVHGLWPSAATVISADGGHGCCQLTSSWPGDWENPQSNAAYAIQNYLIPAVDYWWGDKGMVGDDLIRCASATYNAGLGGAMQGHDIGNVDAYTTDNYGAGILAIYHKLLADGVPE